MTRFKMTTVDLTTALEILGLDVCAEKEQVRKAYLRKALQVHPDKKRLYKVMYPEEEMGADMEDSGPDEEAFTRLHNAYCVAMEHCSDGTWVKDQDVLMRAFRGHDVEADLRRAGVFRPDPMFGIDMKVPFHTVTRSQESDEEMKERMKKHIEDMFPECNE